MLKAQASREVWGIVPQIIFEIERLGNAILSILLEVVPQRVNFGRVKALQISRDYKDIFNVFIPLH